ncbi:alpha/beta hydrolase, partial [Dactylosporangium sp. NPDC051485]|uniref:alpha/beta hydrolase n=1 Tax=Dactylosporangium sp. NPDC051485 TaxID=3154846 RepID=UPI00341D36E5
VVAGARWDPPAAIAVRGTVLLLPGRGEHAGVYDRFGRRLAADGYAVRSATPETAAAAAATAAAPLVLAGSDTGALHALALATPLGAAGVIVAGVPWDPPPSPSLLSWDAELEARSACPTHRARLEADGGFERGTLTAAVPQELAASVDPATITAPVLLVHGEADPIAPPSGARALAARLPRAELAIVRDGRHDAFNDITHRSVAAHVVQWLERLRSDPDALRPILTVS